MDTFLIEGGKRLEGSLRVFGSKNAALPEMCAALLTNQPVTLTQNRPTGKLRATDPDFFETRYEYNWNLMPVRTIHPNGNISETI